HTRFSRDWSSDVCFPIFALALAQGALGLAHGLASLAKAFAGADAHPFKPLHQAFKLTAQLALALLQPAQRLRQFLGRHALALALLTLLALALLTLALLPLLSPLLLVEAKRLVHQFLLPAHDFTKPVHLLPHFGLLPALARLPAHRLKVVHHVLKLGKQLLGLIARAR